MKLERVYLYLYHDVFNPLDQKGFKVKLKDIAEKIGASIYCPNEKIDTDIEISKIDTLERAQKGQISFLSNPAYEKLLKDTKASAVLVEKKYPEYSFIQLICKSSYLSFAHVAKFFEIQPDYDKKVSSSAFVDSSVSIGKNVTIFPNAYISKGVVIEDGVVIHPGCFIGENTSIGEGTILYPNVTIHDHCKIGKYCIFNSSTVIGESSFGFIPLGDKVEKIPQIGTVEIGDYVETGSNCTIGRAALGVTKVGDYTKLAPFVCVGHNVVLGKCCLAAAYTGFAGSTTVGDRNIYGAGVGVVGHVHIADDVVVAAKSNISKSITKSGTYGGHPLLPIEEWRKQFAVVKNIVKLKDKVKELEVKLKELISSKK